MNSIPLYLQKTQMDRQFKKRTYQGFGEFLADLRFLFSNIRRFGKMKLMLPTSTWQTNILILLFFMLGIWKEGRY